MSRLFPHPPYAEDQPLAKEFLIVHVFNRAITTGSIIASTIVGAAQLIPSRRKPLPQFTRHLLRSSCVGSLVSIGLSEGILYFRMRGREDIEWQDRSWRLLESETQCQIDDWTYAGMAVGPAALVATSGVRAGAVAVLGASSLGGSAGLLGFAAWKFGICRILPGQKKSE